MGITDRENFLINNLNTMSPAFPNFDSVNYMNNLENGTTIVSLYVGNDYYIKPEINFIDSRIVDQNFYNKIDSNYIDILSNWKDIKAEYLFVNKNHLSQNDEVDYKILMSNHFIENHLTFMKSFDNQEFYKIRY